MGRRLAILLFVCSAGCASTRPTDAEPTDGSDSAAIETVVVDDAGKDSLDDSVRPLDGDGDGGADAVADASNDAPVDAASVDTPADGASMAPPRPSAGCGATAAAGDSTRMVVSGGRSRMFAVHVPRSYDPRRPVALVMNFHGWLGDANQQRTITRMADASESRGFIAVHATGYMASWNAGGCCGAAVSERIDDVSFVRDMLADLERAFCIDSRRVFSTGFSNGGMLSHRLACELSDRITAIAPVSGVMVTPTCTPTRAVPVFMSHGTADLLQPYGGGGAAGTPGVMATANAWAARNGCAATPPAETFRRGDASCLQWNECRSASGVVLCTIDGGGHQWPGGISIGGVFGRLSTDLDATNAILDFFARYALP